MNEIRKNLTTAETTFMRRFGPFPGSVAAGRRCRRVWERGSGG
jgi:hypothetical protein